MADGGDRAANVATMVMEIFFDVFDVFDVAVCVWYVSERMMRGRR